MYNGINATLPSETYHFDLRVAAGIIMTCYLAMLYSRHPSHKTGDEVCLAVAQAPTEVSAWKAEKVFLEIYF